MESLLVSIEIPQLILHVRLLHDALKEVGTELYVKVGTTGTGGMGLNIPYTHGEDKPSPTLMAKTAVAFAHTGLLFLADRTEGGPAFKELKPAAMIGYKAVAVQDVPGYVWVPQRRPIREGAGGCTAALRGARGLARRAARHHARLRAASSRSKGGDGQPRPMQMACVNTGENGWFSHGEFEAITALDQMEIITPEEIARAVIHELGGRSTGWDVLGALDASIMGPTFKGGLVRQIALDRITQIEDEGSVPSVALGDLGPPQLSKYLFELYLIRAVYETLEGRARRTPPGRRRRAARRRREGPPGPARRRSSRSGSRS